MEHIGEWIYLNALIFIQKSEKTCWDCFWFFCIASRYQTRTRFCTKPLSTIQCNKTLCQDQLVPILLIG